MKRARILLVFALMAALPIVVAADADTSFKKGIAAADLENFEESVRWLRQAIAEDPQESEKKILISGVFFEAYLPHYHLGRVLRQMGPEYCDEALGAWTESERQGVIRSFTRLAADLESSRRRCLAAVLPARLAASEASVDSATEVARQVTEPFSASEDETERRAAMAQLELAGRRLEEARRNSDGAMAEEAKGLAEEAESRLRKLADKSVEQRARRLSTAAAASRQALADAEQARRTLSTRLQEPLLAAARRTRPQDYQDLVLPAGTEAVLADLQRRFDTATDIEAHQKIETEAATLGGRLSEVDRRVLGILAELRAPARQSVPATVPGPAPRPSEIRAQEATPSSGSSDKRAPTPPAIDAQLRSLLSAAETLLGRLDGTGGVLLEAQRDRLIVLIRAVRADPDAATPRRRLASSYAALQVIAGGEALFAGRAADAVDILSSRTLPGDHVGAQGLFLRAVALHRLSRVDDERSASLLDRAARDLSRFQALNAGTPPRALRAFSSDFWRFFDRALDSGR